MLNKFFKKEISYAPSGSPYGVTKHQGPRYESWSNQLEKMFYGKSRQEADQNRQKAEAVADKARDSELRKINQTGSKELTAYSVSNPSAVTDIAEFSPIKLNDSQLINDNIRNLGEVDQAKATEAEASTAKVSEADSARDISANKITARIKTNLENLVAEQGELSPEAVIAAITKDPDTLSQLGLHAAQIEHGSQIDAPDPRTLQPGELIDGAAVDWAKVEAKAQVEAAVADPSKKATVAGQLEGLMADFEGGNTPPWAAGAMRTAMAKLQARGLGASSMAGQAVVQAAMESAIPIAQQDASTFAAFEQQNLSNRQQAALFAAEQRANFLGLEFDQKFQAKVANSARIADIANMNFTAEQQIALENSRLAQTTNLANLDARQAKVLADAAAMSQMDLANLSNAQQAAVENAKSFLTIDMANLNNRQQAAIFKQESINQALFSDQAAINTAMQINAQNEQQANIFNANLRTQTSQFNNAQRNAISQFNAGEANAMSKFWTETKNIRQQFEAKMNLEIHQANTKWKQDIATINSATQNEINMEFAKVNNGITAQALDNLYQRERDLMAFAFTASESYEDRNLQLLLADKEIDARKSEKKSEGIGYLVGSLLFGGGLF